MVVIRNLSVFVKMKFVSVMKLYRESIKKMPNVTSVLHPLDQGVIRSFQSHFHCLLIRQLVNLWEKFLENACNVKISVPEAVQFMSIYTSIIPTTVWNCPISGARHRLWQSSIIKSSRNIVHWTQTVYCRLQMCTEIKECGNIDNSVVTYGILRGTEILNNFQMQWRKTKRVIPAIMGVVLVKLCVL